MHPNAERYDQNFSPWTQTTAAALVLLAFLVSQAASAEPAFSVAVPGKTITLLQDEWIKMEDPTTVGKNFEERKKGPWHQLGRVVTIVPLPMSDDRRIGLKIADREYVEIFIAHPGFVTVQTRIDKGTYWVMCAHSALRADSQRGDRWPCPRPHMNGNYLNIKHKKCKFLLCCHYCQAPLPIFPFPHCFSLSHTTYSTM
jgi:hypothetical protein